MRVGVYVCKKCVCMRMSVCVYICVHVCVYVFMYVYVRMCVFLYMCVRAWSVYVCVNA